MVGMARTSKNRKNAFWSETSLAVDRLFYATSITVRSEDGLLVFTKGRQPSVEELRELFNINSIDIRCWATFDWKVSAIQNLINQVDFTFKLLYILKNPVNYVNTIPKKESVNIEEFDKQLKEKLNKSEKIRNFWTNLKKTMHEDTIGRLEFLLNALKYTQFSDESFDQLKNQNWEEKFNDSKAPEYTEQVGAKPGQTALVTFQADGQSNVPASSVFSGAPSRTASPQHIATLRPSAGLQDMLSQYDAGRFHMLMTKGAIDGAAVISSYPSNGNIYGGFALDDDKITCHHDSSYWWPGDNGDQEIILAFGEALIGNADETIKGWVNTKGTNEGHKPTPNTIKILRMPLPGVVGDRESLHITTGNSDYFSLHSLTELSRMNQAGMGLKINNVFSNFWGEIGQPFPNNCIPYHIFATAVVTLKEGANKFLLIAHPAENLSTLMSGWSATITEQCQGPPPPKGTPQWWRAILPVPGEKTYRDEDQHINDTLVAGLKTELGIDQKDLEETPRLICTFLEQDTYAVGFVYVVKCSMSPQDFWDGKDIGKAIDDNENDIFAAYQIEGIDAGGKELSGPERLAELLAKDTFDGGPHVLPLTLVDKPIQYPWHPSSRLRIYAAGGHLYGEEFRKLIKLKYTAE